MKKAEVKNRLAEALEFRKVTQNELAKKTNIPKSSISQYVSGFAIPRQNRIYLIAKVLNVSEAWLLGYDVPIEKTEPLPKIKLPVLGSVSCGVPTFEDEGRESYISIGTDIHVDFCLIAKGDSMINAKIYDGDIVFVRKQNFVNNGEIAVVIIDEETTLKRFYYYQDKNMIILKAENSKYDDLIYIGEELSKIRVLGKAIFLQTDIK